MSATPLEVRGQERLAIILAAVAGYVDAYGFSRYGAYLAFMSGNTTLAGLNLGGGNVTAFVPLAVGILAFTVGTFAGMLLTLASPRARRTIFALIAAGLALVTGLDAAGHLPAIAAIAIVGFIMGAMNASLSRVGAQSISLTFVTGTLNKLGTHLAYAVARMPLKNGKGPWDTHLRRAFQLGFIWCGFFLGALLGGAATPHVRAWALAAPICTLVVLSIFDSNAERSPA